MGRARDIAEDVETQTMASAGSTPVTTDLGARLGRFQVEGKLGVGGMGIVYAAFDPRLQRQVAVKLLRDVGSRDAKERLLREARAMARLAHPNVVTVYEVGAIGDRDFIAMELVRGESLRAWLRAAPRAPAAIVEAFVAAARGLAAAHAAGIVHRDFKPHNVLRDASGRIAVTDFGLARRADDAVPLALAQTERGARRRPATLESISHDAVIGTPGYMAPEQWTCETITPAADQFAFCVALWEALAGHRPYAGDSADELRERMARGPATLDASRIPRALRAVLRRGL
ncbi:MAG TPA: serine/threonine-protein kinase, partial [Kofleriaceae bacterium]|nr:serine/threonine-protein kinase [Kofleriaceae bacterium]